MRFILFYTILFITSFAYCQDDHDHDHAMEQKAMAHTEEEIHSSEKYSDKYELLAKYTHLHAGEEGHIDLYVSDYKTNKPLDVKLNVNFPNHKEIKCEVHKHELGIYELHANIDKIGNYAINVDIDGPHGKDLLQINNILVTNEEDHATTANEGSSTKSSWKNYLGYLIGLLLIGLAFLIGMKYQKSKLTGRSLSLLIVLMALAYPLNRSLAHEGHGDEFGGGNLGAQFTVPKETQFLLDITTSQINSDAFDASMLLYGTVIPSNGGSSIVSAAQTGKLSSLYVKIGDKVKKGQKLGIVSTFVDVNTQVALEGNKISLIQIEAERNNLTAELEAAKKENDRLQKVADIAAKKEVDEAKARYEKAKNNLELFNKSAAKGSLGNIEKYITLYSPINGVINEFNLTQGSTVSMGQELFKISNIDKVYIEGQIYDKDIDKLTKNARFEAQCVNADHKANIKLISNPQIINTDNQSQKVLFELDNKNEEFKIGEFVNIRMFSSNGDQRAIALPNSAISEVNGKSIIFIKKTAEKYYIQYVSLGDNNGQNTIIAKGLNGGERVVVNGTYQMKMMYLNQ